MTDANNYIQNKQFNAKSCGTASVRFAKDS